MMNDVSFLQALGITLQVLFKVLGNFAPVIVLGILVGLVAHAIDSRR